MSKLVLLAINAKYVHSSLSVWVLAGGVSRNSFLSHNVCVVETTINQEINEIVSLVAVHKPEVVGISTYIWNAHKLQDLMMSLRATLPKLVIVLGGPEASHNSDYWLKRGADHVIIGEGEYSLPALLDELETCGCAPSPRLHQINSVLPPLESSSVFCGDIAAAMPRDTSLAQPLCEAEGKERDTTEEDAKSLDPIDPYSEDFLHALKGRIAYLETSRGCPFRCAFCLSGESSVRFFPLQVVKSQIDKLSRSGTKTIKLVDRTFNCDRDRAYELFAYIISLDTDCCFHFEVAADLFDVDTLSLLSSAAPGRIQLEAGLQSFHEPALTASSRKTNIRKAEENIRELLKHGNIHLHLDLIAGLPYETLPDFINGFNRAFALRAHTLQLGFLKLLHGSVLRKQANELGICYSADPPYEITGSPWMNSKDLQVLKKAENALQRTYNKGRFLSTLEYVFSVSKLSPFELFHHIGEAAPNHGTALNTYAKQLYDCLVSFPNIDNDILKDAMTCDWLAMVKGKNLPQFLKKDYKHRKQMHRLAESKLGRTMHRDECVLLSSGKALYVDSADRDPVTSLYRLHYIDKR